MDEAVARATILSVWVIGAAVWMWSFMKALGLRRRAAEDRAEPCCPPTVVRGPADRVPAEIRRMLAVTFSAPFGIAFATRPEGRTLHFSLEEGGAGSGWLRGLKGRFDAGSRGSDAEVSCEVSYAATDRRASTWALAIILGLGLPAVALLPSLLLAHVAASPNPAVRWQSIQVVQMVHVLWPPFLVMHLLSRQPRKVLKALALSVVNGLK